MPQTWGTAKSKLRWRSFSKTKPRFDYLLKIGRSYISQNQSLWAQSSRQTGTARRMSKGLE